MANQKAAAQSKEETEKAESKKEEKRGPKGSGWGRVNPEQSRFYAHKVPGSTYIGELLGRFARNDNPNNFYYQVKLGDAAQVRNADGEVVDVEEGAIVNIDEMKGLQDLQAVAAKEGTWEVYICFEEKVKIAGSGGHTFWRVDCQARQK